MKILITGIAGMIGSHLADALISQGHGVVGIDNLSTGKKANINPKADFYHLDIRDFKKIKPLFQDIDYVFHLAAVPSVPRSIEDPVDTSSVNILGTVNVFKAAVDAKVKRIIFISSSAVYGNQETIPFKEDMKPDPMSPYGLQKFIGEQTVKLFVALYKVPIICLRYFNVYGPRIDFNSDYSLVIGKFLKLNAQNKPLTIFGDGEQTRGFCYVDDVVAATVKAVKSKKLKGGEVINISSSESYSVNYLAKLIGGKVQHLPQRTGDVLHAKADIALAKDLLSWQPKVSFAEGLKRTIQWYRSLAKSYENIN